MKTALTDNIHTTDVNVLFRTCQQITSIKKGLYGSIRVYKGLRMNSSESIPP